MFLENAFWHCAFVARIQSLLYTNTYMTAPRAMPVSTSNTECCLMNMVERMMDVASRREAILMPRLGNGKMRAHGVIHMDAWPEVRGGVRPPEG